MRDLHDCRLGWKGGCTTLQEVTNASARMVRLNFARLPLMSQEPPYAFDEAAFDHPRPGGSRFDDERRGAWYSADSVRRAADEVGWHHVKELLAIERLHDVLDYEVLAADFRDEFYDARGLAVGTRCAASRSGSGPRWALRAPLRGGARTFVLRNPFRRPSPMIQTFEM